MITIYLAGKLAYRMRHVLLMILVAGFVAVILNPMMRDAADGHGWIGQLVRRFQKSSLAPRHRLRRSQITLPIPCRRACFRDSWRGYYTGRLIPIGLGNIARDGIVFADEKLADELFQVEIHVGRKPRESERGGSHEQDHRHQGRDSG